jgi:hypothetical protein
MDLEPALPRCPLLSDWQAITGDSGLEANWI